MRQTVIRLYMAAAMCLIWLIARPAAAAIPAPEAGGYSIVSNDLVAGLSRVLVGKGLTVDTLVADFQKDYDPSGATKLTWEDVYAANRAQMIPVCVRFVVDESLPSGVLSDVHWNVRGAAGESVWQGCDKRTAWLIEGTTVSIPVKPLEALAEKAKVYDDPRALKARLGALVGAKSADEAVDEATRETVSAAKADPVAPAAMVPVGTITEPAKPVAPAPPTVVYVDRQIGFAAYFAFSVFCGLLSFAAFVYFRVRTLRKEREMEARIASAEDEAEQVMVNRDRQFLNELASAVAEAGIDIPAAPWGQRKVYLAANHLLGLIKAERAARAQYIATMARAEEAIRECTVKDAQIDELKGVVANGDKVIKLSVARMGELTKELEATKAELVQAQYAAKAAESRNHVLESLLDSAEENAGTQEPLSTVPGTTGSATSVLVQVGAWADSLECFVPIKVTSRDKLAALGSFLGARVYIDVDACFGHEPWVETLRQQPEFKRRIDTLEVSGIPEFLKLFEGLPRGSMPSDIFVRKGEDESPQLRLLMVQ